VWRLPMLMLVKGKSCGGVCALPKREKRESLEYNACCLGMIFRVTLCDREEAVVE